MKAESRQTLLQISWISGVAFLSLLIALHFIESEFDPTWRLISEYEIGQFGWIMRLAFFCWGSGFLLLTISLWSTLETRSGKIGKWWMFIISIALFAAGIFATQPITDTVRGNIDQIHAVSGAIMIFTFPIVSILIAVNLSKQLSTKTERQLLFWITVLVWIGFIVFFSSIMIYGQQVKIRAYGPDVLIGLPNRFMVLTYTIWLIIAGQLTGRAIETNMPGKLPGLTALDKTGSSEK